MDASTSSCGNESTAVNVMDSPSSGFDKELGVDMEASSITIMHNNVVDGDYVLEPKHKVFLSHSGAQKDFVEQLCVDLQRFDRYPFFDKLQSSLPIGEKFPMSVFEAIKQCQVGVLVFSEEFFMKKWPMLELNAMVKEFEKPKSRMKIIPLFYHISLHDWKSPTNRGRWISQWEEWAEKDKRIDVEEWKKALRVLGFINSLEMKEGMGDVKFRKEIVKEICGMIPQETRWDDSHVQGRSRICEVICKKMEEVPSKSTPCVVGLHGVGGIGKTTICKALCNYVASKFHDHVCHVELGQGNEMKMLQKALKMLTSMSHELLNMLDDMDQGYAYLKKRMQDVPVFLALDNVQDDPKSIETARAYLRGGYGIGSVVLVTARTKDILRKLNVEERQCLEMLELEEEDARSLFLSSCGLSFEASVDERIIRKCLQVCYLYKGDGIRRHYHPLALKVLGQQLGSNIETWEAQLTKINKINELEDVESIIFSILRSSFESLPRKHKLIFMDVALGIHFLESSSPSSKYYTILEWLCMVHEEPIVSMKDMLELLKRRSIVENLSDDFTRLGMHDLWREFAILELKAQDSKGPQWVYQVDGKRVKRCSGHQRESVERMVFVNEGWKGVTGLNLADFVNVEVFKLEVDLRMRECLLHLDLSGLTNLKSLEVVAWCGMMTKCDGLSSLTNLGYLYWDNSRVLQRLDGLRHLTTLQFLHLWDFEGVKVLNLRELKLLRVVELGNFPNLIRVVGLSSRMVTLRYLQISSCDLLREFPGLGELFGLEKLELCYCGTLEALPRLGQLKRLRNLVIQSCNSIKTLCGLGDLVNLEELQVHECLKLAALPGLSKLMKLQILNLWECPVVEVPGLGGLTALTRLEASFDKLQGELPALSKLSLLISANIKGWNGQIWAMIQNMPMLESLFLSNCNGEDVVPDLEGLTALKVVELRWCNVKVLSELSSLTALESLSIEGCEQLQRLPEFERLTNLRQLQIRGSYTDMRDWPSARSLRSLTTLEINGFPAMKVVSAVKKLSGLRELMLSGSDCENVLSMASCLEGLNFLRIENFDNMEVLDLSNFPQAETLQIIHCGALRRVTCSILLPSLTQLMVGECQSLLELPDLGTFPQLAEISLWNCNAFTRLSCSSRLIALQSIHVSDREILPELNWFPNLDNFSRTDVDFSTPEDDEGDASGKCHHLWKLLLQHCCNQFSG